MMRETQPTTFKDKLAAVTPWWIISVLIGGVAAAIHSRSAAPALSWVEQLVALDAASCFGDVLRLKAGVATCLGQLDEGRLRPVYLLYLGLTSLVFGTDLHAQLMWRLVML